MACDAFTVLMLHCDGTDASTTFTDSEITPKTVTAVGNAQIDTAQFKFGTASFLSDGSGDYLTVPDSADWNFGSGNFTIDFWVRFNATTQACFFAQGNNDGGNTYGNFRWEPNTIRFNADNTVFSFVSPLAASWTPSTATWYHVALIRGWGGNANDFAITIDGTAAATGTSSGTYPNYTSAIAISQLYDGAAFGYSLNGWIDEYRVSKGIARWTTTFTPPTSPYCADTSRVRLPLLGVN